MTARSGAGGPPRHEQREPRCAQGRIRDGVGMVQLDDDDRLARVCSPRVPEDGDALADLAASEPEASCARVHPLTEHRAPARLDPELVVRAKRGRAPGDRGRHESENEGEKDRGHGPGSGLTRDSTARSAVRLCGHIAWYTRT